MGFQLEALEALLDDAERAFAVSGDEPYEDPAGRPVSVLANVPAGIAFLRASLARLRGDARASSMRLAASTPATWPRSCAPAAGRTPCRRRGEPPPRRRA